MNTALISLLKTTLGSGITNEEEFNIRVKWPDGEVNGFLFKALGFEWGT